MRVGFRFRLVAMLGCAIITVPGLAAAQTRPRPAEDREVTVTGRRMPAAEAPRSSTCEVMASDSFFRALLAVTGGNLPILVPTRMPRNPDYNAPPLVPVGSPLPDVPESRFGVRSIIANDGVAPTAEFPDGLVAEDEYGEVQFGNQMGELSREQAVAACRSIYQRGNGAPASWGFRVDNDQLTRPSLRGSSMDARFASGRAQIVRRDKTLPLAFMLFDQGRYAESLDWFRKAEKKLAHNEGGDEATLFIGKIMLQGLGDASDPVRAVKWLKKTANMPFNPVKETPVFDPRQPERNTAMGEAAVILGNIYRNGFGPIAKDPDECRKWFAKAYAVGHIPAAKILGDIYFEGIDTQPDVRKAMSYYKKAATLDYPAAQVAYADILREGASGVKANPYQALGWYNAAAKHEYAPALYAMARAYDFGDWVEPDPEKAIGFYKEAAVRGHAAAANAIGTYFYEGGEVARDPSIARGWFEAAAKAEDAEAMFNLAAMYARGEGGDRSMPQAWIWMLRATQAGHQTAPRALAVLETRMSPAEKQAGAAMLSRP